jgi:transglutaminase-like putative cysteine protease
VSVRGGARRIAWWSLRAQWGVGVLLLALFTDVSRGALSVTVVALAAGVAMDLGGVRRDGLSRLGAPLAILILVAAAADLLIGSRDLLSSITLMVLGVQSIGLLLPKRVRDGWQLCAVSFLEFLAAAASTDELLFAPFAFLFLTSSAGAMWGLHLQHEEEVESEKPSGGYDVPARAAAAAIALSGAGGFLLCAALFATVPRLDFRLPLHRLSRAHSVTGFSETITFREVTGVKTSRRVVARVEFPVPPRRPPTALYLRGVSYSRPDAGGWKIARTGTARAPRAGFHYIVGSAPGGVPLSVADITLEPADHPALFAYVHPVTVEGAIGEMLADGEGNLSLSLPQAGHPTMRYRVRFAEEIPPRRAAAPGREFLEIPAELAPESALGREIAGDAGNDAERADRLLRFLRSGFRYTLTDPASSLREFLFEKRAGYCEHFAAALAMMLRGAGIPSRVAAGYYGGEWSDLGRYLIVRESDAHAWTEGWIDGRWVTLDATPPPEGDSPFLVRTGKPGLYLDWVRQRWDKYVINYSLRMQAEAVAGGWSALRRTGRGFRGLGGPGARTPLRAAALAGFAGLGLFLLYRLSAGRKGEAPHGGPGRLPPAYARLARRLEREGYRPVPGTSMGGMLSEAVRSRPALAGNAGRFLDLYHRDRFGARPLSPAEREEAFRLAGTLRRGARSGRAR